jgi:hypothetical protein
LTKVVKFVSTADRLSETSQAILHEYLALIEDDEVSDIAIVGIRRDGVAYTNWTAGADFLRMAGAISKLQHDLHTAVSDD